MSQAYKLTDWLLEVDVRDFIDKNPRPYRLEQISPEMWRIFVYKEDGSECDAGSLYLETNVPDEATQYWRDNLWAFVPIALSSHIEFFPTQALAIEYAIRTAYTR